MNEKGSLIDSDKYRIKAIVDDDGHVIRGDLTAKTYKKENGKFYFEITQYNGFIEKDTVIYHADDLNDQAHIEALLIVDRHIHLTQGNLWGNLYYDVMRFLANFRR